MDLQFEAAAGRRATLHISQPYGLHWSPGQRILVGLCIESEYQRILKEFGGMYAIIEDGGKQYRVEKGDKIHIEMRELPESAKTIEFDRVLMIGDGAKSKIGDPVVSGAKVTASLETKMRGPKLEIVKFRRRKGYKLHKGHRQDYLKVTIDSIAG